MRAALRPECTWEPADPELPLYRLGAGDLRAAARDLSCGQAIAADGAFAVAMLVFVACAVALVFGAERFDNGRSELMN